MRFFFYTILFTIIFFTKSANAQNIENIEIIGNKRISDETVLVLGNIDLNIFFDDQNLDKILNNLYSSNFFADVRLSLDNNTLKIDLIENPIIENIEFIGVKNKRLISLIVDKIYSRNRVSFSKIKAREDLNIIKDILKQNGYYFSEVNISQNLNEELNSTNLFIDINLGNKAKINKIKFIGNKILQNTYKEIFIKKI